ncbi:hypothetical protein C8R47DRAFT_1073557 [Mycena vitilis]|nr:hypothetical protein C8R47DRAFT_1073557 [Mycena vitilis]
MEQDPPQAELLEAFRAHYHRFQASVTKIIHNPTDAVAIARLGDDVDEFARMVQQNLGIFPPEELDVLQLEYRDAIDLLHNGRPTVIHSVSTGVRGHPQIVINPDFLRWAYSQRTSASIHRFLGMSRDTHPPPQDCSYTTSNSSSLISSAGRITADTVDEHVKEKHVSGGPVGSAPNLNAMLVPRLGKKSKLTVWSLSVHILRCDWEKIAVRTPNEADGASGVQILSCSKGT